MGTICPHCGCDYENGATAVFGRLLYSPRLGVCLDGKRIKMSPRCHELLGILMQSAGGVIERSDLEARLGYKGRSRLVSVLASQIRGALRPYGLPSLIERVGGVGLRFNPNAAPEGNDDNGRGRLPESTAGESGQSSQYQP